MAYEQDEFWLQVSKEEYEQDRETLVLPGQLSAGELYRYRHILLTHSERKHVGSYAVERLVGLQTACHTGGDYYDVRLQAIPATPPAKTEVLTVSPPGFVVKSLIVPSRMFLVNAGWQEVGYFLPNDDSIDEEWADLTVDEPLAAIH